MNIRLSCLFLLFVKVAQLHLNSNYYLNLKASHLLTVVSNLVILAKQNIAQYDQIKLKLHSFVERSHTHNKPNNSIGLKIHAVL